MKGRIAELRSMIILNNEVQFQSHTILGIVTVLTLGKKFKDQY